MKSQIIFALCFYIVTAHPFSLGQAETCEAENCKIENNCRCSDATSPLEKDQTPQFVIITVDESLVNLSYTNYWVPLLTGRSNPDGNPISATFFVPHEYTDYEAVNKLYNQGFEIADGSITKNSTQQYWQEASGKTLQDEFKGQATVISTFANIPIEEITGVRTPLFALQGDVSINAYVESKLMYDNTWTTRGGKGLWPYTLDCHSQQSCDSSSICPVESHPGFWMIPLNSIRGKGNMECVALNACQMEGKADEISNWLLVEIEKVRNSSKTPVTIVVNSVFLSANENLAGFGKFLDGLATLPDVFLISHSQLIDWVKNPVSVSQFRTNSLAREAKCDVPVTCPLTKEDTGLTYYMRSCVPCPDVYPWLGNPTGSSNPTTPNPATTTSIPTTQTSIPTTPTSIPTTPTSIPTTPTSIPTTPTSIPTTPASLPTSSTSKLTTITPEPPITTSIPVSTSQSPTGTF